jgi:tRNA modification GTPase
VGARLAEPGEFTLRAVVHGKLDLTQAEAVRDFIDAQTQQQAKNALMQMAGSVSRKIRPTKQRLVDVIAQLEAGIDFAEDDIDVPANETLIGEIRQLQNGLENLANTFSFGTILSRGLRLTIVGKPNVGKSSLFNQLLCADRAIVTQIPGTTRDVLTETINLEGVPLSFADTAGVREAVDEVERIGVERTMETLSDSDFALVVLDGSTPLERDDQTVLESASQRPHVLVINKSDLPQRLEISALNGSRRVSISAKTGQGLEELREELRHFLLAKKSDLADDLVLTSVRQYEVVTRSAASLSAASKALAARVPHEMVLLDLYSALSSLGEMTGDVTTEDILDRIFSTFCVGK